MSTYERMRALSLGIIREKARSTVHGLMWFAMLRSTDPEKQKALDRLHELRIGVQDIMDVLAPGWEKEPGI